MVSTCIEKYRCIGFSPVYPRLYPRPHLFLSGLASQPCLELLGLASCDVQTVQQSCLGHRSRLPVIDDGLNILQQVLIYLLRDVVVVGYKGMSARKRQVYCSDTIISGHVLCVYLYPLHACPERDLVRLWQRMMFSSALYESAPIFRKTDRTSQHADLMECWCINELPNVIRNGCCGHIVKVNVKQ